MSVDVLTQAMIDAASEGHGAFTTRNVEAEGYLVLRDDAPTWVRSLVYAAHRDGDILPDRWRYTFAHDGLGQVAGAAAGVPRQSLVAEIEPDLYTTPLVDWLGVGDLRLSYCDRVLAASAPETTIDLIRRGQRLERLEVFDVVWNALAARAGTPSE